MQDSNGKGLVTAMQDLYDWETKITYDAYRLLPTLVTDPIGLSVSSKNDYRVLAPIAMTDPNKNLSKVAYNALGLVEKTALCGKDTGAEGDTLSTPGAAFTYNFFAFLNDGDPISVLKTLREHHINADYLSSIPVAERNNTISSAEYSDGYGRMVQSRAQAEDIIYGNQTFGDSGLPADQSQNGPAVGVARSGAAPLNVVVSGHKRYNNKGEIIAQWEPYFDSGFDYAEDDALAGVSLKMYYDALGRMVMTVNPDGSEQRVVFGIPNALNTPGIYTSTPWERYMYDANDLAGETHPGGPVPTSHHYTPKSEKIDTLGRVKETTEHKAHYNGSAYEDVVMKYVYDIKGQLMQAIDPYDRVISDNKYDTAGNMLSSTHIDRGAQNITVDAMGLPTISNDAKGARTLNSYDALNRPVKMYARDSGTEPITLRQVMQYGDSAGLTNPENLNLKGKLYIHNDEAGKLTYTAYDFKGNLLDFYRQVINDTPIPAYAKYVVDWNSFNPSHLSSTKNTITQYYDGLNRIRKAEYPQDKSNQRKVLLPKYNRAGPALAEIRRARLHQGSGLQCAGPAHPCGHGQQDHDALCLRPTDIQGEKAAQCHVHQKRQHLHPRCGHKARPALHPRSGREHKGHKRRRTREHLRPGPGNLLRQFTHDPMRRLLSATGRESSNVYQQPSWDLNLRPQDHTATNTYTRQYSYDKIGNIQALKHIAAGHANQDFNRAYGYGTGNNLLEDLTLGSTVIAYQYDASGNMVQEAANRYYDWGANGKMSVFKDQAGTSTPSVYTNYFYNAQGERVKKHTRKGNKIIVTFYIDGGLFETSYTKTVGGSIDNNRHYNTIKVMDGAALVATVRVGNNADDSTPATKYVVDDHLGNSTAMVQANGAALINREEFYPFGETSFGSFKFKRYRYNGKEKDEHTGLYNYGQRYYAPWLCRFVSVDPIAEDYPQLSGYNYAGNKPITHVDIDGLQSDGDAPVNTDGGTQLPVEGGLPTVHLEPIEITGVATETLQSKAEKTYWDIRESQGGNGRMSEWNYSSSQNSQIFHENGSLTGLGEIVNNIGTLQLNLEKRSENGAAGKFFESTFKEGGLNNFEIDELSRMREDVYTSLQGQYIAAVFSEENLGIVLGLSLFSASAGLRETGKRTLQSIAPKAAEAAVKASNLVKIREISDDIIVFSSQFGDETIEGMANFKMVGDKLHLNGLHLQGSTGGQVGRANLWNMAKDLGRQFNAKEVIIQGGKRTTGKYKGTVPSPVKIKVK